MPFYQSAMISLEPHRRLKSLQASQLVSQARQRRCRNVVHRSDQVIHTVLFVGGPHKAFDPVSLADVSHQVKKRGERLFIDCVRVLCIGRDFDRDRSVIVGRGRTTPGTVLFFHIHSDFAVVADPKV